MHLNCDRLEKGEELLCMVNKVKDYNGVEEWTMDAANYLYLASNTNYSKKSIHNRAICHGYLTSFE